VVSRLRGSDAQAFIDIMDEVYRHTLLFRGMLDLLLFLLRSFVQALTGFNLASHVRKKCVKMLYRTCALHTLFPRSLRIELCDDPTSRILYRGGFGDVSKCEYQGREVAVKRLRIYATSDLQKIIRVGILRFKHTRLNTDHSSRRGSARSLCHGKPFDIQTCCRS